MEEFSFDATQFSIDGRPRFLVATFTKNWDKFPTNSRDDSCFHHFGYILSDNSTNYYRLQHGRIDEKYMNTSVDSQPWLVEKSQHVQQINTTLISLYSVTTAGRQILTYCFVFFALSFPLFQRLSRYIIGD